MVCCFCCNWNHEFFSIPENPKVQLSFQIFKLKYTWIMQQNNDQKNISKSTIKWLKKENKIKVLEWPSQSSNLNLIRMLWHNIKKKLFMLKIL